MWFGKWFGARDEADETDEPARFNAPTAAKSSTTDVRRAAPAAKPAAKGGVKGFDPYNSGSFERRNAWERIGRR